MKLTKVRTEFVTNKKSDTKNTRKTQKLKA